MNTKDARAFEMDRMADEITRLRAELEASQAKLNVDRITKMLREHIPRYLDFERTAVAFRMLDLSELAELICGINCNFIDLKCDE